MNTVKKLSESSEMTHEATDQNLSEFLDDDDEETGTTNTTYTGRTQLRNDGQHNILPRRQSSQTCVGRFGTSGTVTTVTVRREGRARKRKRTERERKKAREERQKGTKRAGQTEEQGRNKYSRRVEHSSRHK